MDIKKSTENETLCLALTGRLDTTTSPQLDDELAALPGDATFTLDLAGLEYLSSAGLRVLLSAHKRALAAHGSMRIRNCNESVMEVFEMTGFSDILTLED